MIRLEPYREELLVPTREVFVASWTYLAVELLKLDVGDCDPYEFPLCPTAVAMEGEQVLGFSQVRQHELQRLYVAPQQHRRGVGALLMAHGLQLGVRFLWVDEDNSPARQFYESWGFVHRGGAEPGFRFPSVTVLKYELPEDRSL